MNFLSENLAIVATVDPDAYTTGDQTTDVVDMSTHDRVLFIVMAGALGSSATLNFKVYGDTASGGSFATQITGKEITPLTQAGTDSDKQAIVEVSGAEAQAQGFRYLRGTLTVGVATSDAGVIAVADGRYAPVDSLASLDQVVA